MSQPKMQRKPYNGLQRKLIIAFDVGTTFSGASYAFLIPGEPPEIRPVTQFPGQEKVCSNSKMPSVVCYDEHGNVVAVGSETDIDTNPGLSGVEGLVWAEWFKLHLRPAHLVAEQGFNINDIPPLPTNKTAVDVFGDILRYMYECTKRYIRERQGNDILESVGTNVEFILSHPNGWEGKQQSEMRHAAVNAGLAASAHEASERINFVTEGEASLHFCLNKIPTAVQKYAKDGILIADCGGGTVDISTYARSSGSFKELTPAECLLQGSFFVSRRAQMFLTGKLRGSRFGTPEDIEVMTRYFDQKTKPTFKESIKSYFLQFSRHKDSDPLYDIRSGGVKVTSTEIADFFKPAIQNIINIIEEQYRKSSEAIKAIFMVGGFASSDYMFSRLEDHFKTKNIDILRPDDNLNKAVADGAIIFRLDHSVSSRVARYTYGIKVNTIFKPSLEDHLARADTSYEDHSGQMMVPNYFSSILQKDIEVSEEKEFRASYLLILSPSEFHALSTLSEDVIYYRNRKESAPVWIDVDPSHFVDLCEITVDMTKLKSSIRPRTNQRGAKYYVVNFDVVILFGLTELKAQMAWTQDGVEKRGPTNIVYGISATADI